MLHRARKVASNEIIKDSLGGKVSGNWKNLYISCVFSSTKGGLTVSFQVSYLSFCHSQYNNPFSRFGNILAYYDISEPIQHSMACWLAAWLSGWNVTDAFYSIWMRPTCRHVHSTYKITPVEDKKVYNMAGWWAWPPPPPACLPGWLWWKQKGKNIILDCQTGVTLCATLFLFQAPAPPKPATSIFVVAELLCVWPDCFQPCCLFPCLPKLYFSLCLSRNPRNPLLQQTLPDTTTSPPSSAAPHQQPLLWLCCYFIRPRD